MKMVKLLCSFTMIILLVSVFVPINTTMADHCPPDFPFCHSGSVNVTPWQSELDKAYQLIDQAVGYLMDCSIVEAEPLGHEIYDIGTKIKYDYGQAEEGELIQGAGTEILNAVNALSTPGATYVTQPPITKGGEGIELGPCIGSSDGKPSKKFQVGDFVFHITVNPEYRIASPGDWVSYDVYLDLVSGEPVPMGIFGIAVTHRELPISDKPVTATPPSKSTITFQIPRDFPAGIYKIDFYAVSTVGKGGGYVSVTLEVQEGVDKKPFTFIIYDDPLPPAFVGKYYSYSFCDPKPSSQLLCGGLIEQPLNNPVGGVQPYTFQKEIPSLNIHGRIPFGLTLHPNGVLDGIPDKVEAGNTFDFKVCAIDNTRNSVCKETRLKVLEASSDGSLQAGGGGCLIATATFGSELAPRVQQLRETRDKILLHTQSGTSFMTAFNNFYYTFSPTVADWERENPIFKAMVKITITPLITTLSILNYVPIHSEAEMLIYGIGIILLNTGMYFVAPAVLIIKLRHKL